MLSTHCVVGKKFLNAYYHSEKKKNAAFFFFRYQTPAELWDSNNGKLSQVTLILPASDVHRTEGKYVISKHLDAVSVAFGSVWRRSTHSCRTYYA